MKKQNASEPESLVKIETVTKQKISTKTKVALTVLIGVSAFAASIALAGFVMGIENIVKSNGSVFTEFSIPTKEKLDFTAINQNFKETTKIDLKIDKIKALSISGRVQLNSEAGLVRVILLDSNNHEYLVYETNNLLQKNDKQSVIENVCEETCILESITPISIKVQVVDAELTLSSINTLGETKKFDKKVKNIREYKKQILKSQNQAKIKKYNYTQKSWTAGETSVSKLSYEDQKKLFTREDGTVPEYLPNLQGFLYYKGGVFTFKDAINDSRNVEIIQPPINPPEVESNIVLPDSWDWRNVHGQNWNTSVKNQAPAGTCWAFAKIGVLESQINLYYNKHLNLNLSEQMMVDCRGVTWPYPNEDMNYNCQSAQDGYQLWGCRLVHAGISDENCDPYVARQTNNQEDCSEQNICSNWSQRTWKINSWQSLSTTLTSEALQPYDEIVGNVSKDNIKKQIIKKGPAYFIIFEWNHAVVVVGYEKLKYGITIAEECGENSICFNGQCISISCNNIGDHIVGSFNGWPFTNQQIYWKSGVFSYYCNNNLRWEGRYGLYECEDNQFSINGQCVDSSTVTDEFRTCTRANEKILEYDPNNSENIWIFKNSWGINWGENGYGKMVMEGDLLGMETYFGPFTPPTDTSYWPTGFDNTINCEDKDRDGYCNWGISENKPDTCPSTCGPEKDCDDSNPDLLGFKSKTNLNCKYRYEIQQ